MGRFDLNGYDLEKEIFVIAEIGHNHKGDIEICKSMFKAAAKSGANAVKLQKRDNRSLFTRAAYDSAYDNPHSFGRTYGEHREALEFGMSEYKELKEYADSVGMLMFATPFDRPSVDFLEKVGVPCYKAASAHITDLVLIDHMAEKGKPMFVSTGGCTMEDIDKAYSTIIAHDTQVCLMHCVSSYPLMDYTEANMAMVKVLKDRYPAAITGFSSHESGIVLPVVAYMLGANVIEKHFTLNRAWKGSDHGYSLEPVGMGKMCRDLGRVMMSLGDGSKRIMESEMKAKRKLGRSPYLHCGISKGELLTEDKVAFKSPGDGIFTYEVADLIGCEALEDMPADTLIMPHKFGDRQRAITKIKWDDMHG